MATAIGAEAGRQDFIWQVGVTFKHLITYKSGGVAVDMTGATAKMEVRDRSGGTLLVTPTATIQSPETDGQILLEATPAQTASLEQDAVYDLKLTYPAADADRILEGRIQLSPAITE